MLAGQLHHFNVPSASYIEARAYTGGEGGGVNLKSGISDILVEYGICFSPNVMATSIIENLAYFADVLIFVRLRKFAQQFFRDRMCFGKLNSC